MPSFDSNPPAARADLASWCRPIIGDFIAELYGRARQVENSELRMLSSAHERLWHALLLGDAAAVTHRSFLESRERENAKFLDAVDNAVINELLEVIMGRFARSPSIARAYCHVVVVAAIELGALRARGAARTATQAAGAAPSAGVLASTVAAA